MRWLAALLAVLLAVPAAAQEDRPDWAGVWEGKVGTYPVRLCIDQFDDEVPARGAYYYLSSLRPLSLTEEDGEGGWVEHGPDEPDALWSFTEQTGERLRGTWTKGNRSLPFDLTPLAWEPGEWNEPCGSAAFLDPRLRDATRVRTEPGDIAGLAYVRHVFVPPAHFEDIAIESFTFDPEQPGDAGILDFLRSKLPSGTIDDDFVDCIGGSLSSVGADGYYTDQLAPFMASHSFLVVRENSDDYCGGAHPNAWFQYLTFDRQSGEEVDLFTWLNDAAREHHPADDPAESYDTVLPALRKAIVKRDPVEGFPAEDPSEAEPYEAECREVAEEQEFWTLGLSREGMLFVPSVPHVALPCMATFTVPWSDLRPYLSAEGRAGLARLNAR
jgi:hypothetical protein